MKEALLIEMYWILLLTVAALEVLLLIGIIINRKPWKQQKDK